VCLFTRNQANIFVDDERNAVIADYQLVYVGNSGNVISYEPARWMAPELSESSDYTKATDIFAFAMTIIEVPISLFELFSRYC